LAVPQYDCPQALAALEAAGATVRVIADLAALRREAALLGPGALVVADTRTCGGQLGAGLPALARQEAVVVLVDQASGADRIALLAAGADQVGRSGAAHEIVTLLATVLRRSSARPLPPDVRSAGDITVDVSQRTAHLQDRLLQLTALEFDLLAYFVGHAGAVLSRETLLADVWGYDVGGLDTVTVHPRRLRSKLEPEPSQPLYLQTVWGHGYRLEPAATACTA